MFLFNLHVGAMIECWSHNMFSVSVYFEVYLEVMQRQDLTLKSHLKDL